MKTLKTIKYTLIITMLILLTTSCTDLTEDLVPETKNTELVTGINDLPGNDGTSTGLIDTGGNGTESDTDGGKGN